MSKKNKKNKTSTKSKQAQAPARPKEEIVKNLEVELRTQKASHLNVAKLLLELKTSYYSRESDLKNFYTYVENSLGLAKRTTQQYVKVANARHLHGVDLDWTKLTLLCKVKPSSFLDLVNTQDINTLQTTSTREFEKKYIAPLVTKPKRRKQPSQIDEAKITNKKELELVDHLKNVMNDVSNTTRMSPTCKARVAQLIAEINKALREVQPLKVLSGGKGKDEVSKGAAENGNSDRNAA